MRKALEDESKKTEDEATKSLPNIMKAENNERTVKEKLISGVPPSLLEKVRDLSPRTKTKHQFVNFHSIRSDEKKRH